MTISKNGLELIKSFESFRSKPYRCPAGVPTIGYGTTYYEDRAVSMDDPDISEETASYILKTQVDAIYGKAVNRYVIGNITQNQFDALVSFAYNLGVGALKSSTLLKYHNKDRYNDAANEYQKWVHANGKTLRGLVARRQKERELYLS